MNRSDYRIGVNGTCPKCGRRLTTTYCTNCTVGQPLGGGFLPRKEEAYERRTAERDRLVTELAAANATLDRLSEAVPKRLADTHIIAAGELKCILYPETTNDDR